VSQTASQEIENRNHARKLLMVTSIAGAEGRGAALAGLLRLSVDIVGDRRQALTSLRHGGYAVVIVDDSIAAADPAGLLRKQAGASIVLEANFAISGVDRLAREVRSAVERRQHEQGLAMQFARSAIESELRTTVAGLLLQSQLALAEPEVTPQLANKLHQVVQLAGSLRQRLERPMGCLQTAQ
jgi:hypothetical protein